MAAFSHLTVFNNVAITLMYRATLVYLPLVNLPYLLVRRSHK